MLSAYYPPYKGGIENYTKSLAHALADQNFKIEIFASVNGLGYSEYTKNVRVNCFRANWTPLNNPISLAMIPALFNTNYDLIFVNGFYQAISSFGAISSALRRKPSILVIHGRPSFDSFLLRILQTIYERVVATLILPQFDKIIVLTNSDFEFIKNLGYPKSNIHIIPNAVDTDYWVPHKKTLLGGVADFGEYILYVGALNKRKNCEFLIRAYSLFHMNHPGIQLVVVGSGPLETNLQKLVEKLKISGKVKFLKNITAENLKNLYQNARLLVLPSLSEGLPTVILEAMACGTPVVVSDIPGASYVVKHGVNGFLFDLNEINDLVKSIEIILDNPDLTNRIKRNARETVCKRFSWLVVTKQVANLINRILQ